MSEERGKHIYYKITEQLDRLGLTPGTPEALAVTLQMTPNTQGCVGPEVTKAAFRVAALSTRLGRGPKSTKSNQNA